VHTCIWPCHSLSLAPVKSRLVLPFWYRPTRVDPDKGPLNVCVRVCVLVHRGSPGQRVIKQVWVGVCPFDPDWIHYKNVCVCVCACSTYYASSVNNSLILITYSVTLSISGGHSSAGGHDTDGGTRHWRVAAATAGATQRSGASICTCRP